MPVAGFVVLRVRHALVGMYLKYGDHLHDLKLNLRYVHLLNLTKFHDLA